jgi:16S rRNA (uracil1498-N3)-methyltransferase
MPPRLYVDQPLSRGSEMSLPSGAARHVQVLRLQPGAVLTLFDGAGGEWGATVERIGRSEVQVRIGEHHAVDRELPLLVTLALGMPANERMDTLVEKATELGVAEIQPLVCQRSVLRPSGERAHKKVAHWQAVAVAACEQSGRTRVPRIAPVLAFDGWLVRLAADDGVRRVLLSFAGARPSTLWAHLADEAPAGVLCLSGPEGGLTGAEEASARTAGFVPCCLGPRVLRADTAPLALLAHLALTAPVQSHSTLTAPVQHQDALSAPAQSSSALPAPTHTRPA